MGGDGSQILGDDLGEGVEGGPGGLLAAFIFICHGIVDEERRKGEPRGCMCVVKGTAGLPWWERFYAVDLVLQSCYGA